MTTTTTTQPVVRPTSPIRTVNTNAVRPVSPIQTINTNVVRPVSPIQTVNTNVVRPVSPIQTINTNAVRPVSPIQTVNTNVVRPVSPIQTVNTNVVRPVSPIQTVNTNVVRPASPIETVNTNVVRPASPIETVNTNVVHPVISTELDNQEKDRVNFCIAYEEGKYSVCKSIYRHYDALYTKEFHEVYKIPQGGMLPLVDDDNENCEYVYTKFPGADAIFGRKFTATCLPNHQYAREKNINYEAQKKHDENAKEYLEYITIERWEINWEAALRMFSITSFCVDFGIFDFLDTYYPKTEIKKVIEPDFSTILACERIIHGCTKEELMNGPSDPIIPPSEIPYPILTEMAKTPITVIVPREEIPQQKFNAPKVTGLILPGREVKGRLKKLEKKYKDCEIVYDPACPFGFVAMKDEDTGEFVSYEEEDQYAVDNDYSVSDEEEDIIPDDKGEYNYFVKVMSKITRLSPNDRVQFKLLFKKYYDSCNYPITQTQFQNLIEMYTYDYPITRSRQNNKLFYVGMKLVD